MASDFESFTLTETIEGTGTEVSVDFKILTVTPPDRSAGPGNARLTVEYQIAHAAWIDAKRLLLGWPEVLTADDGSPEISRHVPHQWDETDPNVGVEDVLFCVGVSRSRGQNPIMLSPVNAEPYNLLNITAIYEALPYRILTDDELDDYDPETVGLRRYVDFGKSHGTATLGRSGRESAFCYARTPNTGETLPSPNPEGVFSNGDTLRPLFIYPRRPVLTWGQIFEVRYVERTLIWMFVPQRVAPLGLIAHALNRINDGPFYIWADQTAMLIDYDTERCRAANGEWCWHIHLKFKIQPRGWHTLPDPNHHNRGEYFPIVYKDAPFVGPYRRFNFYALFSPAQEDSVEQGGDGTPSSGTW